LLNVHFDNTVKIFQALFRPNIQVFLCSREYDRVSRIASKIGQNFYEYITKIMH